VLKPLQIILRCTLYLYGLIPLASTECWAMSTETVLLSKPLHEYINLTLKNFYRNVPFGLLSRPTIYICVPELPYLRLIRRTSPTAGLLCH